MSKSQIAERIGDCLQAQVSAVMMVDLSLFLPVAGAVGLLAAIIGLVLWKRHGKAQTEADVMEEP